MSEIPQRLSAVRRDLPSHGVDALVVGHAHNRRYLSGFTGSSGLVIITATEARLLVDPRYHTQALREAPDFHMDRVNGRFDEPLAKLLRTVGGQKVGFEADSVTVSDMERYREAAPEVEWVATSGLVERHRAVKSPSEIARLRSAVALTDEAMAHAVRTVRPGMTEKELAWAIEMFMRENGAEGLAFPSIVAAGENGALPHHRPSDRPIQAGEPIVIDIGAHLNGYCGDLTRTFSIGPCDDPDFERVYAVVAEANQAATLGIKAGMTGPQADALARDYIKEAGFGDCFGHGLGHGVGLYIHELPRLGFMAGDDPLEAGMVATIEPGIYVPDRFGVRIEDVVIVGDAGVEVVTRAPKQPVLSV